jgi:hypothetical protein
MPGTHLPVETVSAISHVFSNIIMVSAAMAVWQHGIPKPWADMVREENDSDFLRSLTEGAMRVFGINLDKMAPISLDALDPTKSIRGTSFLPVNWLPMGRAALEYYKTWNDDPRIAKLKAKEQELIVSGNMEEVYKVREERQRIADIDEATRTQRLFNLVEKYTGIPFIAVLKDSLSPTNVVLAIANDRLDYRAISAQRLADATKKEGVHDFAFTDSYAPYMALRTWLGWDSRTGQSYAFDYQKFYDSIKGFMWDGLPEPMQDRMARLFAGYALEMHDKLYSTDMYFNALAQNGAFPGPGTSITQNFVQDMKRTLDNRGKQFDPADPYGLLEHTENLQRAVDAEAGRTMKPKAQPGEVDSTWMEGVWDRLQGRAD